VKQHIESLVGDGPMVLELVRRHGARKVIDRCIEVLGFPPSWITDFKELTQLEGEL